MVIAQTHVPLMLVVVVLHVPHVPQAMLNVPPVLVTAVQQAMETCVAAMVSA